MAASASADGSERARPVLGAALIVRDEEHHLPDCLASLRGLVDEVVVVDTGSIDATVDIARSSGARCHEIEWPNDFSAARNHALSLVRSDWVLYIDADERVRQTDRASLLDQLADPALVAANVDFHPRTGFDAYRELRLFRSDPRLRFEGVIHETIWPAVQQLVDDEHRTIGETDLVLDHIGFDGPQDHKHPRNLPLLRAALERDPHNVYCWYHLGTTLDALGDVDAAREAWRRGIDVVRRSGPTRPADSLPHVELIRSLTDAGEDAHAEIERAAQQFPDDRMIAWYRGRAALDRGDVDAALPVLVDVLDHPEHFSSTAFGYDHRLFTSITSALIATGLHRIGDHAAAAGYMRRAELADPTSVEYRTKRLLFEHLAR